MDGKILITGCSGFIGNELINHLSAICKSPLIGIARREVFHSGLEKYYKVDLSEEMDLSPYLKGVETIVHTAGMAHTSVSAENEKALEQLVKINVDSTVQLAKQALSCGAKRFIFISSIGVNGAISKKAFTEEDKENPSDPYTKSKFIAEQKLKALTKNTKMDLVIIRPPLVYGKGAPGTFRQLMSICRKKIPLPFATVHNKRSMIYIENLASFIGKCMVHSSAGNQTFLVSDGTDVSISSLIKVIRDELNLPRLLFPTPKPFLKALLRLIGKAELIEKLMGNLQVNPDYAVKTLDWYPPYTFEEGIKRSVSR